MVFGAKKHESFEIMKLLMEIKGEISDKILTQSNATLKKMDGIEETLDGVRIQQTQIKTFQEGLHERLVDVEERPKRYLKISGVAVGICSVIFGIFWKMKGH